MARRDKTGPLGQGSMTGRGFGDCNSNVKSGVGRKIGYGAGIGAGIGLGLGLGRKFCRNSGLGRRVNDIEVNNIQDSNEARKAILEKQLEAIKNELDSMK